MTNPWEPHPGDLQLLFDLVVELPQNRWDDVRAHFHEFLRDGTRFDAEHIEELIRKSSARRAENAQNK